MVVGHRTDLDPEQLGVADEVWRPGDLLRGLYATYHGYDRFADEHLGVPLATWLAVHRMGPVVTTRAAEVLEDHEGLLRVAEEDSLDLSDGDDDRVPVDELADRRYQELEQVWTDCVGE